MLPPIFVLWLSLELVMRASAGAPREDVHPAQRRERHEVREGERTWPLA